jgi:hypothetical protein
MDNEQQPPNSSLDVKLDYIQRGITEIKGDIKEIKSDYMTSREYEIRHKELTDKVTDLMQAKIVSDKKIEAQESFMNKSIGVILALQVILGIILAFSNHLFK